MQTEDKRDEIKSWFMSRKPRLSWLLIVTALCSTKPEGLSFVAED